MSGLDTTVLNNVFKVHEQEQHGVAEPLDTEADCLRDVKQRYDRVVPLIDIRMLAQAIRFVEATRANIEGYVWEGPEPEWFDGYAEDITEQYDLLTKEAGHA
jgi:hypothetical protein